MNAGSGWGVCDLTGGVICPQALRFLECQVSVAQASDWDASGIFWGSDLVHCKSC